MNAPTPGASGSAPPQGGDRLFNNADSFAHAFDQAWHSHSDPDGSLEIGAKLELILERIGDHPFAQADPATARQVGEFRIRLLGL
ncbi:MAG: hypothetical protein ACKO25_01395 [Cyanobium sp.]